MKNRNSKKSKSLQKKKKFFKKTSPKVSKQSIFPSISRFIPEVNSTAGKKGSEITPIRLIWNKYFLVSFISVFISVGIALQGVALMQHLSQLQKIRSEREQTVREIAYWEGIVKEHDNYRDGYFKLALLEYRLGDRQKTREYLDKVLFIDPNYEVALEFQKKIEGK